MAAVTVTTTATRLDSVATAGGSAGSVAVYNNGSATVFLGNADVTSSGATKGVPLAAGQWYAEDHPEASNVLYGIVASGTVEVLVREVV